RADLGELAGLDAERPRAVAIMGGPMSVNDDLPWLRDELALLRRFIERRIPLIGHCLGGQLLARALGATVRHQPYTEMGWQPMQRESRDSPWLAGLPERFSIFQWHGDAFDLPQGAERLLSSPWCENQGFSWGDHVLGLQGHPEMTEELVRRLKDTLIEGNNAFLASLDPRQVASDLVDDRFVRQALAEVGGLQAFGLAEGFQRSEEISP
ncbi:MAG: type 1 glutamine amidotransferase, partial [Pseudomonas aeruginosa]|nr:type 1 glutamine amidotransferase [Pseudomonas aeruginosa]